MIKLVVAVGKCTVNIIGSAIAFGIIIKGSTIVASKLDKIVDDDGNFRTKRSWRNN